VSRFRYEKAWGAEPLASGGSRFRLWAPAQERLALRPQGGADLPMRQAGDGWFEIETDVVPVDGFYSFVLADGMAVNDPAARAQMDGVSGPSRLVDPGAYEWKSADWRGRPLEEVVYYELHTGTFSPEGTFDGIRRRLDHLAETGVTAIELLPVAQFGGKRGWGYDGVLLYAPHVAYGGPEGLKRLVDEAHQRGLMMILDVVYNHFGPDGNYIPLYAPDFFHPELSTPWGAAIAYENEPVRRFFIDNALYWLEEYRFDGMRFDAIDQIEKQSDEPLLTEIGGAIRAKLPDRHIHLSTEDERNITRLHERGEDGRVKLYSAEWNDDVHHAAHVLATGEQEGYYIDYADDPVGQLARALATGFIYQGEASKHHDGKPRGVPSAHQPPAAFVDFLQNHDQIGNRAFGERLTALAEPETVEALTALLLLSPHLPLLYMGEEFGETRPFYFFTDFHDELGDAVREGRRKEFAKWPAFSSEESRQKIPDPNAQSTFEASKLDWAKLDAPAHRARFDLVKRLLATRRDKLVPLIARIGGDAGSFDRLSQSAFVVRWKLSGGGRLALVANLGAEALPVQPPRGEVIAAHRDDGGAALSGGNLAAGAVVLLLESAEASA
jgi:maltooligosyltrehalose trehalohydrolase